jgi:hypothetical protein
LRADQDLLKAQLLDAFDALARFRGRADEIDRCHLRQLRGFRTLGEVDRAIGEDGILAAGFNTGFIICGVIMLVRGIIGIALMRPERETTRWAKEIPEAAVPEGAG